MKRNLGWSVVFVILFLLCVTSIICGIISIFSIIPALVFLALFVYNSLPDETIEQLNENKAFSVLYKIVANVMQFVGIVCGVMLALMIFYSVGAEVENPDTVIVLGCQVKEDKPSSMLKDRLNVAYNYLTQNEDATAIVCGGKGDDETLSEAKVMKNYLVKLGIDESRIIEEDKSINTYQNINFAKEIIDEKKLSSDVLIVTDWYHQLRATRMAKDVELRVTAKSAFTNILYVEPAFYREVCAVAKYMIFGGQ